MTSTVDLNVEGAADLLEWETMTKFHFQRLVKLAAKCWVPLLLLWKIYAEIAETWIRSEEKLHQ